MQLMAFVEDKIVDDILSLSDSYMLYYHEEDKYESDLNACNHTKYGEFFDLSSGNRISIAGLMNFEIVNANQDIIFKSSDMCSDHDVILQYGIFSNLPEEG